MLFVCWVSCCPPVRRQAMGALPAEDSRLPPGRPPLLRRPRERRGGFAIELPAVTFAPGEEREVCFAVPLPLQGPSRLVNSGVVTTGPGLHHGNITTRTRTGDGVRTCDSGSQTELALEIAAGGSVLFASSTRCRQRVADFSAGICLPVGEDQEIVARMHYLNASSRPLVIARDTSGSRLPRRTFS